MTSLFLLITLLLLTSVAMALAMMLAWFQFGRERHVLFWSLSYAASVVQWLLNLLALVLSAQWIMYLSGVATIAAITMTLAGVRTRDCPAFRLRGPVRAGAALALLCAGVTATAGAAIVVAAVIPAYVAALMALSAWHVLRPGRALRVAEISYGAVLVAFALFEIALVWAGFNAVIHRSPATLATYRLMIGWGLPALFVAAAIASILMVAGDLAERLARQSLTDALTGIYNRRGLDDVVPRTLATGQRQQRTLTFVLCDLDGFKALNDSHGHVAGDTALQQFAAVLGTTLRQGDIVGRLGGDEFAVLLVDADAAQAGQVMERVRERMADIVLLAAPGIRLRSSFGITQALPEDRVLQDLVIRADRALYQAKAQGRDRVCVA